MSFLRKSKESGDVEILTAEKFAKAVDSTVSSTGLTVDQLLQRGKEGTLKTHRERVAYDLVRTAERSPR